MDRINEDITAYLEQVVAEEHEAEHSGTVDACMEDRTNKELFGVCLMGAHGRRRHAGQAEERFPLQSVSKALSLALALEDVGAEALFRHVGKEPTGDPYHSVATLEEGEQGMASNPMVNAGAIAVTAMIRGGDGAERFERLRDFVRNLADNPQIDYNRALYEAGDHDLNRALFYYMRNHDVVAGSEEDSLVPYLKQTNLEMDCLDLARIAAVFANRGRDPHSGAQLIAPETVRIVLTLMLTTGMYHASGAFAVDVGIPAKSGVSGAIMAVVPGRMGFGVIGPALDEAGNSIAGVRILQKLATRWQLPPLS